MTSWLRGYNLILLYIALMVTLGVLLEFARG